MGQEAEGDRDGVLLVKVGVEMYIYARPPTAVPKLSPPLYERTTATLESIFAVGADGKHCLVRECLPGTGFLEHKCNQICLLNHIDLDEGEAKRCGCDDQATFIVESDGNYIIFVHIQGNVF